jgi:hypothetical protein
MRLCESPGVTLPELNLDLGPFGLLTFYVLLLTCASRRDYQGGFLLIPIPLICSLVLFCSCDLSFTTASFTLAISPSSLQFIFGLHSLLAQAMVEECSPLLYVVGDMSEVTRLDATRPEASASSSSSEDSSRGGSSKDVDVEAETKTEKVVVVDPRESVRSYDFMLSTIIVGRIQQLETLRYFSEGFAHEPGEETIPKIVDDKVVVFEEFFAAGLQMPPHPALTEILLK